jgi:hypothetical protein
VVGGKLALFTNPFLLGLVPLDIMLAHAFLRVLALPKTSSASLSHKPHEAFDTVNPVFTLSCKDTLPPARDFFVLAAKSPTA